MRRARTWVLAAVLIGSACAVSPRAYASVSFTVVLDSLVHDSTVACVVTPVEIKSVWEDGRIATYTRVHVERVVAGTIGSEAWIKTMGGSVGDIGQRVEGEAVLRTGQTSLLFLTNFGSNLVVTARGQGQFVIVRDGAVQRLRHSASAGVLLAPRASTIAQIKLATPYAPAATPASDVLDGKSIDDAAAEINGAWSRTHAHP